MREPTEMELRLARAGYEAMRNAGLQNFSAKTESPDAFLDPDNPMHAFEKQPGILQMDWVMAARAMIHEMREPTDEMVAAGDAAIDDAWAHAHRGYVAMIDAASPPEGA